MHDSQCGLGLPRTLWVCGVKHQTHSNFVRVRGSRIIFRSPTCFTGSCVKSFMISTYWRIAGTTKMDFKRESAVKKAARFITPRGFSIRPTPPI